MTSATYMSSGAYSTLAYLATATCGIGTAQVLGSHVIARPGPSISCQSSQGSQVH